MTNLSGENLIKDGISFTEQNSFIFRLNDKEEPIIVINNKGFSYKGEIVEDKAEVYELFKKFLQNPTFLQTEIVDEDIEKASELKYPFDESTGSELKGTIVSAERGGFYEGAKWCREKQKKQNS